jgi:hypothetical protein
MPRSCTVCEHPEREAIDEALVGGASNRSLASLYDVSEAAVRRHKANHLPAKLVMAEKAKEVAQADSLLDQVRDLQSRALAILDQAEDAGDLRTALGAIREARGNLELLAKLLGDLQQEGTTNIQVALIEHPDYQRLRAAVVGALRDYPEAGYAVAAALEGVE